MHEKKTLHTSNKTRNGQLTSHTCQFERNKAVVLRRLLDVSCAWIEWILNKISCLIYVHVHVRSCARGMRIKRHIIDLVQGFMESPQHEAGLSSNSPKKKTLCNFVITTECVRCAADACWCLFRLIVQRRLPAQGRWWGLTVSTELALAMGTTTKPTTAPSSHCDIAGYDDAGWFPKHGASRRHLLWWMVPVRRSIGNSKWRHGKLHHHSSSGSIVVAASGCCCMRLLAVTRAGADGRRPEHLLFFLLFLALLLDHRLDDLTLCLAQMSQVGHRRQRGATSGRHAVIQSDRAFHCM